jgi:hypothetical protein
MEELLLNILSQEKPKMSTAFIHCNREHVLIWFWDDTECPACEAIKMQEELREVFEDMESSLYDAATELERLRSQVSDIEDDV